MEPSAVGGFDVEAASAVAPLCEQLRDVSTAAPGERQADERGGGKGMEGFVAAAPRLWRGGGRREGGARAAWHQLRLRAWSPGLGTGPASLSWPELKAGQLRRRRDVLYLLVRPEADGRGDVRAAVKKDPP